MTETFQQTLQAISNRCRKHRRVGAVIPWEFILAVIALIQQHCPQWNSVEGFLKACKEPGPFAKWWLLPRVNRLIDNWNTNAKGFGGRIPSHAGEPILDELFDTVSQTSTEKLVKFHTQLTRVMRGEDPDEEG